MAFIAAAIIGGVGAVAGGLISAHGASSAANTQASAADEAAQLQAQQAAAALAEQQREFNVGQTNLAPWLSQGRAALGQLSYLMGLPTGSTTGGVPATGTSTLSGGSTVAPSGVAPGGIGNPNGGGVAPPSLPGAKGVPSIGDSVAPLAQANLAGGGSNTQGDIMAPGTFQGSPGTTPATFNPNAPVSASTTAALDPNNLGQYVNTSLGAPGSLLAPYPGGQFTAPTLEQAQQYPGYQFALQQGLQSFEHGAAAKGDIFSGGTAQQEQQLAQDYANQSYGNVYNQALNTYQTNYNAYQQQQANTYNRLAGIAGSGQTTAGQLTSAGLQNAAQIGNIDLTSGAQIGSDIQAAAAARASGYAGGANAIGGALSGGTSGLLNLYMMQQLMNGGSIDPYGQLAPGTAVGAMGLPAGA